MNTEELLSHIKFLKKEKAILETLLRPEDTGHIRTAISVLDFRIDMIREQILKDLDL
jgi:hypothetical protein